MLLADIARFAANNAWRDSDWAVAQLREHAGKTLRVELWPAGALMLRITADGSWETVAGADGVTPDATLRMTPSAVARLARLPDKPGAALDLTGDPVFVAALRDLHDVLPLAFDERLSSLVGPIVAHGLTTVARGVASWPAHAAARFGGGAVAYATEESTLLVGRRTFGGFAADVAATVQRVDRLLAKYPEY